MSKRRKTDRGERIGFFRLLSKGNTVVDIVRTVRSLRVNFRKHWEILSRDPDLKRDVLRLEELVDELTVK